MRTIRPDDSLRSSARPERYRLEVDPEPSLGDGEYLESRLHEHNIGETGHREAKRLTLWMRNDAGEIGAGLYGWTWGGTCHVRDLWVREDLRRHRYGTTLLRTAERVARNRGCHHVVVETYSFQAPRFYEQRGYDVFGVLEDDPRGHRNYYLQKRLD